MNKTLGFAAGVLIGVAAYTQPVLAVDVGVSKRGKGHRGGKGKGHGKGNH